MIEPEQPQSSTVKNVSDMEEKYNEQPQSSTATDVPDNPDVEDIESMECIESQQRQSPIAQDILDMEDVETMEDIKSASPYCLLASTADNTLQKTEGHGHHNISPTDMTLSIGGVRGRMKVFIRPR